MKQGNRFVIGLAALVSVFACNTVRAADTTILVNKRFLNLPVSQDQEHGYMSYEVDGKLVQRFQIRLSAKPQYWYFSDMSEFKGKRLTIRFEGSSAALSHICQADEITGNDSLYKERNRPQFHFTARRGWVNDPNGLVFYEGEYHLFFQHNPFERNWGNMSWGHAVSKDLVHWNELPVALHPDHTGLMFSGSIVIDYENVSGFGKPGKPAMVAFYTADSPDKELQCVAYSIDNGRSWTKYNGNPILDTKSKWQSKDTRDPKVFWHQPSRRWVMVLNEKDGHSIYNSTDLLRWTYESHIAGFWECPELFELKVEGSAEKKWVMYGASNNYLIGAFDGKTFKPETSKQLFNYGAIYAAQTFNNIPQKDGRRIQIGWGKIPQKDMPFNNMMTLPTVLTLRKTIGGVRLFSEPVKELDTLFTLKAKWSGLTLEEANQKLAAYSDKDRLRIRTTIELTQPTEAGLNLYGQRIIGYNMTHNLVNNVFYSPVDPVSMKLQADIYIDRTSLEIFFDKGAFTYYVERQGREGNLEGFRFWGSARILSLEVFDISSIWQ